MLLNRFLIADYIKMALKEDLGFGDITTDNIASESDFLKASLNSREDCILCGCEVFSEVFKQLSNDVEIKFYFKDGDEIKKGDKIADISGSARVILNGERVALNFVQRMSGIATKTHKFKEMIKDFPACIADTRKTTPNFRIFEKYAVQTGGGTLHRFNLSDCVMIKDNHIKLAGSIREAVGKIRENLSHAHKIEVECDTLDQVKEALECDVDIILLDNMSIDMMKLACSIVNNRAIIEASGNVNLDTLTQIASCGVDVISSSSIVAKAEPIDLAIDI